MQDTDWHVGHTSYGPRINVKKTLKQLRREPLSPLLAKLHNGEYAILEDEFSRYMEAYELYYLSLERFLPEMSLAVRWSKGPYYVRKYGGRYTDSERQLAQEYNKIARYLHLDFFNCLLYARILLDRAIAFSKYFLQDGDMPSYTSFSEHKKYFKRLKHSFGAHEAYAAYMRDQTAWFDMPLKIVRDKFLVHTGPKHIRVFGYTCGGHEFGLMLMVPTGSEPNKPLANIQTITVSVPQMAADVGQFLAWLSAYGLEALGESDRFVPAR